MQKSGREGVARSNRIGNGDFESVESLKKVVFENCAAFPAQGYANGLHVVGFRPAPAKPLQREVFAGAAKSKQDFRFGVIQLDDRREAGQALDQGEVPMALAQVHVVKALNGRHALRNAMENLLGGPIGLSERAKVEPIRMQGFKSRQARVIEFEFIKTAGRLMK